MTSGGLHSDECCLWTSVVVSLLTSTPPPLLPLLPLLRYDLRLMFWLSPPTPPSFLVSAVTIAPHSGLEGRHRGPQCPLWNHQAPLYRVAPNLLFPISHHCPPLNPLTPGLTLVFPASGLHCPHFLRGWREGGECTVVTMVLHLHQLPAPKPPRMPCVCVLCVHHHPKKKKKKKKKKRA